MSLLSRYLAKMHRTIFCLPELEEQLKPVVEELNAIARLVNLDITTELVPSAFVPEGQIYVAEMDALMGVLFAMENLPPSTLPRWGNLWLCGDLMINRPSSFLSITVS